jgi:hypothetical protein
MISYILLGIGFGTKVYPNSQIFGAIVTALMVVSIVTALVLEFSAEKKPG